MASLNNLSEADLLRILLSMFITQDDIDDYAAGTSILGKLRTVDDINTTA